ncbi:MAG: hypothetical protein Kow0080_00030 [Candidatus Promineifilaceae bacterium]
MPRYEFVRKIQFLLGKLVIIVLGIGLIIAARFTKPKMMLFQSQFHNIELQYPEGWSVQDSAEELSLQHSDKNIDAGITIMSNPPKYMEEDLLYSLESFIESELLPDVKEILTMDHPIRNFEFNDYEAVQGQMVADVAKNKETSYALKFEIILAQHEDNRVLIVVYWRGGTETIHKDVARDVDRILSTIRFR